MKKQIICTQKICEYNYQCEDCTYKANGRRKYKKTGIDRSNPNAYHREWMAKERARIKQLEMEKAGVV